MTVGTCTKDVQAVNKSSKGIIPHRGYQGTSRGDNAEERRKHNLGVRALRKEA